MGDRSSKSHKDELREMILEAKGKEPADKVLSNFCQRHGVSMTTCKKLYDQLVAEGKIKKE
jgi:hypothetical protein